jgi:ribonuclease P protein component
MLPFKNRLRKRNDFNRVYKRGRAVFSQNLTLRYIRNNFAQTRIGILVNKSFSQRAVQRNKMKRIIREAVREYLTSIEPNFDIVISCARKEKIKGKTDFAEIKNQVKEILKKSNLLKQ